MGPVKKLTLYNTEELPVGMCQIQQYPFFGFRRRTVHTGAISGPTLADQNSLLLWPELSWDGGAVKIEEFRLQTENNNV